MRTGPVALPAPAAPPPTASPPAETRFGSAAAKAPWAVTSREAAGSEYLLDVAGEKLFLSRLPDRLADTGCPRSDERCAAAFRVEPIRAIRRPEVIVGDVIDVSTGPQDYSPVQPGRRRSGAGGD